MYSASQRLQNRNRQASAQWDLLLVASHSDRDPCLFDHRIPKCGVILVVA